MARRCLVYRHVPFEDLGTFAPVLRAAGYAPEYREAGVDRIDAEEAVATDLLIILGGPIGVYETEQYPFLDDEVAAIRARLEAGGPTFGVCLGLQLIAIALGGNVGPSLAKEIGWALLRLTEEGKGSVLAPLDGKPVLHWHGDIATLPAGARRLAETDICRNQAFMLGDMVLALQFHIEVDPTRIEQWLIGHRAELGNAGIAPATIRADTERYGANAAMLGVSVFRNWLSAVEASEQRAIA